MAVYAIANKHSYIYFDLDTRIACCLFILTTLTFRWKKKKTRRNETKFKQNEEDEDFRREDTTHICTFPREWNSTGIKIRWCFRRIARARCTSSVWKRFARISRATRRKRLRNRQVALFTRRASSSRRWGARSDCSKISTWRWRRSTWNWRRRYARPSRGGAGERRDTRPPRRRRGRRRRGRGRTGPSRRIKSEC